MKTSRLKAIVIAILAMLNLFLLAILAGRDVQERAARSRAGEQLVALYAASNVELNAALIPREPLRLASVDPVRDVASEAAFADMILDKCEEEDVGGGIYRYANRNGTCLIRASGAVEAALDRRINDPDTFSERLFSAFGYVTIFSDVQSDGTGTIVAARMTESGTVFNARLQLHFFRSRLLSVVGSFVPAVEAGEGEDGIDGVTALVRFLDYSNGSGEVCTAVTDVCGGYLLQSTASAAQRLIPAWCVTTDVSRYYVNMMTGEVTRDA